MILSCCDLLEKSYLCGINNNWNTFNISQLRVVICLKNRTFVVSTTTHMDCGNFSNKLWFAWKIVPLWYQQQQDKETKGGLWVVICLKNRTFVVSTTTGTFGYTFRDVLWFAWKIVPLWYQQQHKQWIITSPNRCDLLEKSYLCGINNNLYYIIIW